ncbi:DUF305 domain-containing protein [Pseudonocardia endophytica]|uniref:Uncharacterized protein (DUF305 family) n=1 Tax=Pseudonocardia endophytica TaxID=401976 RepID=A0A4R1HKA7_PSEEN|nr:DUF305 domain-containing protein [Pseudonocardia endophytica]TCK22308.1 uncharacterized protein (DUF305 family) [Pseudonocardia endophytica]
MKTTHAAAATVVSAAAVVVLSACGTGCPADCPAAEGISPAPAYAAASYEAAAEPHNQADVTFATAMVPHHQQAVQMAPLATDRSADGRVRSLAAAIQRAQEPEIQEMNAMLAAWCTTSPGRPAPQAPAGAPAPAPPAGTAGIPGMDHMSGRMDQMSDGTSHASDGMDHASDGMDHASDGMPGMMSAGQMRDLEQSSGPAFDRAFLTMMIAHHEGGVAMARTELASGANPQARALAQSIVDSQQREIAQMRGMLA